jgi:hypothetical protein
MVITKDMLKQEIDRIQDEYANILYDVIKAFERPVSPSPFKTEKGTLSQEVQPCTIWLPLVDDVRTFFENMSEEIVDTMMAVEGFMVA